MIKIRPHHILCMKAYIGKGYSEDFNVNMKYIIKELEEDMKCVKVVFGLDDLCNKCPHNMGNGLCKSQEKVTQIDSKVIKYFNIKAGEYEYKELKDMVFDNLNEEKFDDICCDCEWYGITNCKELNLKR